MEQETLRYPVGKYRSVDVTDQIFEQWVETIETLPELLKKKVTNLTYDELELTYRPDGWNVKQVVHHLADSHMNSFIRFKLALTEERPAIRTYLEDKWAELHDANNEDISDSLGLLEGLHNRWTTLLRNLSPEDRKRSFVHPEYANERTIEWLLGLYDWHCRHHLAHIDQAIELEGKFEEK